MEFSDLLRRRKMVRGYTDESVPREAVVRIVERARKAPSAGFSQGTRFVAVTDEKTRRELAQAAGEAYYVERGFPPWISQAPVHVVIGIREESYHERYRQPDKLQDGEEIDWPVPYWWVDAGAAMMLALLAALDEGLDAGYYGFFPDPTAVRPVLGLPDDVYPMGGITIGHASSDQQPGSRRKFNWKPLDEVVRWERW